MQANSSQRPRNVSFVVFILMLLLLTVMVIGSPLVLSQRSDAMYNAAPVQTSEAVSVKKDSLP